MLTKIVERIKDILLYIHVKKFEKFTERNFKKNNVKWCKRQLTPQQKKEVQDFYRKNVGFKIDLTYHSFFYSLSLRETLFKKL